MTAYAKLHSSGQLAARAEEAVARLECCELCPRRCRVNRLEGERGFCRTGRLAAVASYNLHFGEEGPLVGENGSGTVFFAGCNLGCAFCQNWDISSETSPESGAVEATPEQLAGVMLKLAGQGAHNINLVTPSHVVPQILEALVLAAASGLDLPLVYNTSGYDSLETLALLHGVVDIYMPDVKFVDSGSAKRYCNAADYPERARDAVAAMHAQVGDLELNAHGVAVRGLLVRHLIMPGGVAGTEQWMQFLSSLSKDTYINVMDQYRPCGPVAEHPDRYPEIRRRTTRREYEEAVGLAHAVGLHRLEDRDERMVYALKRLLR